MESTKTHVQFEILFSESSKTFSVSLKKVYMREIPKKCICTLWKKARVRWR